MKKFFVALAFMQMSTSSLYKVHILSIFAREFEKVLVRDMFIARYWFIKINGRKKTNQLVSQ